MSVRHVAAILMFLSAAACVRDRGPGAEDQARKLLPLAAFNPPAPGETISGTITLGGWGIHESGIKAVHIYVDRQYLMDADIGVDRPDVAKAFPTFQKNMITGWNSRLDTTTLPPGPHELLAKVQAKDGAERDVVDPVVVANAPK